MLIVSHTVRSISNFQSYNYLWLVSFKLTKVTFAPSSTTSKNLPLNTWLTHHYTLHNVLFSVQFNFNFLVSVLQELGVSFYLSIFTLDFDVTRLLCSLSNVRCCSRCYSRCCSRCYFRCYSRCWTSWAKKPNIVPQYLRSRVLSSIDVAYPLVF